MGLWNIGGEGQLTIGAIAATGIGLFTPLPGALLPIAMVIGAMLAACGWALIAAVPRALFGLNEIIVTLFLNYIAIQLMTYLVNGPWGDRSAIGFAFSPAIPARANLPLLTPSLSLGIVLAVGVALAASWVANRTPLGMTIRLVGSGTRLAEYLQLRVGRLIVATLGAGGAIAGLAGAIEVMGVTQRLQPGISSNYGYSGILVAFIAAGSVLGVITGALIYGALIVGGLALQGGGVPFDISVVVQALIILFLLCGQAALRYRIRRPA
jgi:simple sugar transport system permease protein